jgi:sigma-B regulation protein RsbU (phosphoserine phosphatase)
MAETVAGDIAMIGRLSAVPSILEIVSATTGLRFAAVARVTEDSWTACAVLDKIGFGLTVGDELEVTTTLCHEIRAIHTPIVIEKASEDLVYRGHPTPRIYGFESYLSVPIIRRSGEMFGTICALDPLPAKLRDGKILEMVQLHAELIAAQIDVEEQLVQSHTALASAVETAALREQFIAVLGHDLRNPLFSIISGMRLLERGPAVERSPAILRQMQQSATRMSRGDGWAAASRWSGGKWTTWAAGSTKWSRSCRLPIRAGSSGAGSTCPAGSTAIPAGSGSSFPTCWPTPWFMARTTSRSRSGQAGRMATSFWP